MCGEDSPNEERIYKIGDKFVLFEFYGHNDEIGKAHVQITELPKDQKESCFDGYEGKVKDLPIWMDGEDPVIICCDDFKDTIEIGIENALESMWVDDLTDEEMNSIPTKLQEKIDKFVKKNLLKNVKGLDI